MEALDFGTDEDTGLQTLYHMFPYTTVAPDLRSEEFATPCALFASMPGRKSIVLYPEAGKKLPHELQQLASQFNSASVNVTAKLTKSDSLPSFACDLGLILTSLEAYQVNLERVNRLVTSPTIVANFQWLMHSGSYAVLWSM